MTWVLVRRSIVQYVRVVVSLSCWMDWKIYHVPRVRVGTRMVRSRMYWIQCCRWRFRDSVISIAIIICDRLVDDLLFDIFGVLCACTAHLCGISFWHLFFSRIICGCCCFGCCGGWACIPFFSGITIILWWCVRGCALAFWCGLVLRGGRSGVLVLGRGCHGGRVLNYFLLCRIFLRVVRLIKWWLFGEVQNQSIIMLWENLLSYPCLWSMTQTKR